MTANKSKTQESPEFINRTRKKANINSKDPSSNSISQKKAGYCIFSFQAPSTKLPAPRTRARELAQLFYDAEKALGYKKFASCCILLARSPG